jgi:SAM-dependent methyltransferase
MTDANRPVSVADIRGADTGYLAYHAPRYAFLLRLLAKYAAAPKSVLDIGPSPLTELLRRHFPARVDTLGFGPDHRAADGDHYELDLNDVLRPGGPRADLPRYDVIVMAEVIEHVHTAPEAVLGYLRAHLAEGGVLALQTPNAVSLPKRIKMIFGLNPYERLRLDPGNPGHFREYTLTELLSVAGESGFTAVHASIHSYFDARFAHHDGAGSRPPEAIWGTMKNLCYRLAPASLRSGITLLLRVE